MEVKASVVIPVYNEEKFIESFLRSVYEQDFPKQLLEVIVVDGHSSDRTVQIIRDRFPEVRVLDNPRRIVPISMNTGIREARGRYLIRMDAHCIYPKDYFSRLVRFLDEHPEADNVGGVCRTVPLNERAEARAIAIALSSTFGMGNSEFRVGADRVKEVDTVPFGCYRREVFDKIGCYDEELVRNQDNELNSRLKIHGGHIYLLPDLIIDYYARDKVTKCSRMFYQYGLFNPLVDHKLGQFTSLRRMVPLFFVLYLVGLVLLAALYPSAALWFAIPLCLYLLLDFAFSVKYLSRPAVTGWLLLLYPVIHVSYGVGYLDGIFRLLVHKPFVAQPNR